jgi:hypothetical protein
VHERLHDEVQSEEKGVRDACACDELGSHQRGIPTNERAPERKYIGSRAVIFESSAGMSARQLGRNETDLNTKWPFGFSSIAFFGPRNVFDRTVGGRVRNGRDSSCSDKFVVTNCIKNATSKK